MAMVNYSVPDEVKQRFNQAFAGRNKSAIIAELMAQAVEELERTQQRKNAIDRLLARRPARPAVTEAQIRGVRDEARECP